MSSRRGLVILGTRAFAEEVADVVAQSGEYDLAAFGENWERERCRERLLDLPIIWVDELQSLAESHLAVCAIGTTRRDVFVEQARALGFRFAIVRHPSASVSPTSELEPGCIVSAGVIVASNTHIGEHVILNRGVLVGHHTTIGRYVTLSPGANIAGRVTVGDRAYVAMGALVLNDSTIGEGAVVGAGAVVTRDVPPHARVQGVPARVVAENVDPL